MKIKLSLLLVMVSFIVQSQTKFNSEGIEVTRADIEQNIFSKDTTANALVIYEVGKSFVNQKNFRLQTEIKRKLKIMNRNGFDKATEEIYLYKHKDGRKEIVTDIRATVYNIEHGEVIRTKLDEDDIFEEDYNDEYTIVKFTFPNIKEGSVINYSYTIVSPFMFKYKSWYFQEDIPKLYSEYNASIPGNWEYHIKLVGGQKLAVNDVNIEKHCLSANRGAYANCSVYRYVMKDIPAFINESYMTTRQNYLARIEYELKTFRSFEGDVENLTKSWEDTDKEIKYDTDLGSQLRKTNGLKTILEDIHINHDTDLSKAKDIYKYVQQNYKWDTDFKLFFDVSLKTLLREKTGSASEINILLHNLLKESAIEVYPFLISTRQNGLVTKLFPVMSDFNYLLVCAKIDGETYLLDATDEFLTFGQIPYRCLNQYGRLMDFEDASDWMDITDTDLSLFSFRGLFDFNSANELTGKIEFKTTGYHALTSKKTYYNSGNYFLEELSQNYPSLEFSDLDSTNFKKTDSEFTTTFNVKTPRELIGNKVYLNPFIFKFFSKNPFQLQERSYPVDFGYKDSYIFMSKINIDSGYDIVGLPENINLSIPNNLATLIVNFKQDKNAIMTYYKITFKNAEYDPAYYDPLKELMGKAIDLQKNTLIVLEKKE